MHLCIPRFAHPCVHLCIRASIRACIRASVHMYIRACSRTCTCACIRTCMRARLWFALVVDVCVWQISLWILDVEGGELDVLEGCFFCTLLVCMYY